MNGTLEDYDEAISEDYDEAFDDESFYEPAEGLFGDIGNALLGGLPSVASGIGNLVSSAIRPRPSRSPLPRINVPTPSQGVTSAQLNTPAGSATLALPSALVKQDEFRAITTRLEEGINRNTSRLNTVSGDVSRLRNDFIRIETDTRTRMAKMRAETRKFLDKSRKEQGSQQTTNLMMSLMMQQQIQNQLNEHIGSTTSSNNMMFMLMPMMMAGDNTSTDTTMITMLMLMMVMTNQGK